MIFVNVRLVLIMLFFLFIQIITDNFDINMYKCSKSKIFLFVYYANCLFTTNWVKVRDSRRRCKAVYVRVT